MTEFSRVGIPGAPLASLCVSRALVEAATDVRGIVLDLTTYRCPKKRSGLLGRVFR